MSRNYNKHKQSCIKNVRGTFLTDVKYNKYENKTLSKIREINGKLIKIEEKNIIKSDHVWYKNQDKLIFIHKQSNDQFENKKIKIVALGLIYLNCEYENIFNSDLSCIICHDLVRVNYCYLGNGSYIGLCLSCNIKIAIQYVKIKSSIITKITYINHLLCRQSLQDLYPDLVAEYFVIMLQHNIKSLNKIF